MSSTDTPTGMVRRLILKDWYFQRWPIFGFLAVGILAIFLLGMGSEATFYTGTVLLIMVLMTTGIYGPMITVVDERKDQNLPFVLSLPISPQQYTVAKILGNLLLFLTPWLALLVGTLAMIASRDSLPDGLIPLATLLMVQIFQGFCLILAVALVSESLGWTIGAIVLANACFQGFLYYASHVTGIASHLEGPTAVWNSAALQLLALEGAGIVLILAATLFLQGRKFDFL